MLTITDQNRRWWTLAAMALPLILITIDFFGITVALPVIGRDLGGNTTSLEWTINAFMLGFASPLIAVGRVADIVGRRVVLLCGTTVFALASAFCGLAQSDLWLIAGRAVQGIGAAMFFTTSLSIVSTAFPPDQRGFGIGLWTATGTMGSAIGPLIGGFLTETLSWRWFFFVNIPIAVAAIALTLFAVEETRDETAERGIDVPGFVAITTAFVLLVLGIELSGVEGWNSLVALGSLLAAVALLGLFVVIEGRTHNPLVEFELFRGRDFLAANGVAFVANYVFGAMMFFLTLYLQHILDYSPLGAGLVFLAFSVPLAVMSPAAGRALDRWGARRCLSFGMALIALSFLVFAMLDVASGVTLVIVGLVISAVGQGFAYNDSTAAAMSAVDEEKAGAASGVVTTIRMVALAVGVAVTGVLFKSLEDHQLARLLTARGGHLTAAERIEAKGLLSGSDAAQSRLASLTPAVADNVETVVNSAFLYALGGAMGLCLVLSLVGFGSALLVGQKIGKRPSRAASAA